MSWVFLRIVCQGNTPGVMLLGAFNTLPDDQFITSHRRLTPHRGPRVVGH